MKVTLTGESANGEPCDSSVLSNFLLHGPQEAGQTADLSDARPEQLHQLILRHVVEQRLQVLVV